jgi:hypothetical protein
VSNPLVNSIVFNMSSVMGISENTRLLEIAIESRSIIVGWSHYQLIVHLAAVLSIALSTCKNRRSNLTITPNSDDFAKIARYWRNPQTNIGDGSEVPN